MILTIPYKEVNKKLKAGMKLINEAISLVKTHVVIAEVKFPAEIKVIEKKARVRKVKVTPEPDYRSEIIKGEGKDLPDLDKNNPFYNGKK